MVSLVFLWQVVVIITLIITFNLKQVDPKTAVTRSCSLPELQTTTDVSEADECFPLWLMGANLCDM